MQAIYNISRPNTFWKRNCVNFVGIHRVNPLCMKNICRNFQVGDRCTQSGISFPTMSHIKQTPLVRFSSNLPEQVAEKYERKTPIEHILLRPGMYVGQVEIDKKVTWIFNKVIRKMEKKNISYSPALLKIFDEILVNAADNRHRDNSMSRIDVNITKSSDSITISVENDGIGIPVVIHPKEKVYIPELIFGNLLTGSNFNDDENLMTGGRHGYGAKLTNIFSKSFEIETYDETQSLLYSQSWKSNMTETSPPTIIKQKTRKSIKLKNLTKISFTPDLKKFGYSQTLIEDGALDDFVLIATRRVYDIAATVAPIRVSINGEDLDVKSFEDYVELFKEAEEPSDEATTEISSSALSSEDPVYHVKVNDRWTIAVKKSHTGEFENISFVNSVWTSRGGTHVNYITNQIIAAFEAEIEKKKLSLAPGRIRSRLMVFIRSDIENPTFDSQSKDTLTKKSTDFGSECILPDAFLKKLVRNSGIVQDLQQMFDLKSRLELEKLTKTSSKRSGGIIDVPKLEDAHNAGTKSSLDCTLVLTEGDSAKALAVAGIEVVGRKTYGVLPLRGKILNVRDVKVKKVGENIELVNLVKALGLSFSKDYANGLENEGLRYGHVMIMCDQDNDGSHIKGLIINFFHHFWPNLLQTKGFLQQFITPLVKVTSKSIVTQKDSSKKKLSSSAKKETNVQSFYSLPEYEEWLKTSKHESIKSVKYYKGLGTNTSEEGQDYFRAIKDHMKLFLSTNPKADDNAIDLAFRKKRVEDRKHWLNTVYDPNSFIDPKEPTLTYEDFVNKELIQFSHADNARSLPSIVDGLKPSQRKVLYACFKRKLTQEMKVVQLAGYVAEQTAYHHGEASLHSTIVNMAQDFVGSNNIPLLVPAGQFGTRAEGGQDHASPRYIFTHLSPIARHLFPEDDDILLDYLKEDEQLVEPRYFLPTIPTVLLNGSEGIGTGWCTNIPQYNIRDIIDKVTSIIRGENDTKPLVPFYRGHKGFISSGDHLLKKKSIAQCFTSGIVRVLKERQLEITELPVGVWTNKYKEYLCKLVESGDISDIIEDHSSKSVKFIITLTYDSTIDPTNVEDMMERLKLQASISLNHIHGFNAKGKIMQYHSPEDIIDEFYPIRFKAYGKRKELLLRKLQVDEIMCSNRARFVSEILSGELDIVSRDKGSNKPIREQSLNELLKNSGYASTSSMDMILAGPMTAAEKVAYEKQQSQKESSSKPFQYLLELPIQSLSEERSTSLLKKAESAKSEFVSLQSKSETDLWLIDIDKLKKQAISMGYY